MRWFDHEEVLKRVASEYVLGTLHGAARRRFEGLLNASGPAARQANRYVAQWQEHWLAEELKLPEVQAPKALWAAIEQHTGKPAATKESSKLGEWFASLFKPVPLAALALGLTLGVLVPKLLALNESAQQLAMAQLPESYVGVLATSAGRTGLIVSSLRRGRVLDIKRVSAVDVPNNQVLFLWGIDSSGKAFAIGEVPSGAFVSVALKATSEELFFKANELAVSLETPGAQPSIPSGAFVYRGLCGKLWKLPPAPPK
jgi:anti-sigma-K factor RskA